MQEEWRSLIYIDHAGGKHTHHTRTHTPITSLDSTELIVNTHAVSTAICAIDLIAHAISTNLTALYVVSCYVCAVVDRDVAWNQIKSITGFGQGGSKTNSLFWVASRNPSPPNYNSSVHVVDVKASLKSSCSANSACDAAGATGMCCPTEGSGVTPGISLGCCPILHS